MQAKPVLQTVNIGLLCLAGLTFPFSVAATNVALAAVLLCSLFSGDMWHGSKILHKYFPALLMAFLLMLGLMLLSLGWSSDIKEGFGKIGHLWFLLLLPAVTSLLQTERYRRRFLLALSIGLTAHLAYCAVQASGLFHIVVNSAASNPNDPAGHIGHIGFGFVYSLWAGWLILHSLHHQSWQRWLPLVLAFWSIAMIFIVQGRGGYLTAAAIVAAVIWKEFVHGKLAKRIPWFIGGMLLLVTIVAMGPGQQRIQQTWQQLQQAASGDIQHSEARLPLWLAAFKTWQQKPWLGHGVGGYMQATQDTLKKHPNLKMPESLLLAHPHNIYLLAMVREGIVGLLALFTLLTIWLYTGWRLNWIQSPAGYLIAAPALALLVNGLTSSSLEEHFSGIIAIIFLCCGLAIATNEKEHKGNTDQVRDSV